MQTNEILKREKLERYFRVKSHPQGAIAFFNAIIFDSKFLDALLPEELLAVGAHEFNHMIEGHGVKRLARVVCIPAAISALTVPIFVLYSSPVGVSFFLLFALWASLYLNANWLRQQETQCDLCAVKYADGEALISALIKHRKLRPRKANRLEVKLLPKTYPTLEQRISDIRAAMESKKKQE